MSYAVDTTRYVNAKGQLHRLDGPAVEHSDGIKEWYQNGQRHRDGGPALEEPDGTRVWYQFGQLHRLDGPAIEYQIGTRFWFVNNRDITLEVMAWIKQQNIKLPMSESEQSFFILTFVGK